MSSERTFARSLVRALLLAALTAALVVTTAPAASARTVLWIVLGAAALGALVRRAAGAHRRPAPGFAAEALLVAAALAFAVWLATPGVLGAALAAWGFGLVLGLRALLPAPRPCARPPEEDAFDAARARALALLEDEP